MSGVNKPTRYEEGVGVGVQVMLKQIQEVQILLRS